MKSDIGMYIYVKKRLPTSLSLYEIHLGGEA